MLPMINPSPKVRYRQKAFALAAGPVSYRSRIAQERRGKKINAPSASGAPIKMIK
jgi:hypothetical protein